MDPKTLTCGFDASRGMTVCANLPPNCSITSGQLLCIDIFPPPPPPTLTPSSCTASVSFEPTNAGTAVATPTAPGCDAALAAALVAAAFKLLQK